MNGMCFDPSHRMPPPPPTKDFLDDVAEKLERVDLAWNSLVGSDQRPRDWIKAESEIRKLVASVAFECRRHARFLKGGEG